MIERQERQETGEALSYVVIPAYSVAIPIAGNIQETLASFLARKGDLVTEATPDAFPVVSKSILQAHFPRYAVLSILRTVTTSFPQRIETYLERHTRMDREGKIRADIQKDKARFERRKLRESRGTIDVSGIF